MLTDITNADSVSGKTLVQTAQTNLFVHFKTDTLSGGVAQLPKLILENKNCLFVCVPQCTCGGQRLTCGSEFFLPILWIPSI